MTNTCPFSWNRSSKIHFFSNTLSVGGCRGQPMLLFENWLMKHKWATLVNMQQEIYYQKSQSFYPSEPFTLDHINMRHPVLIAEGKEIFEKFKKS